METYTIAEAATKWIGMVEASTKATAEEKQAMIDKINSAAPKVLGTGFGALVVVKPFTRFCFTDATNAIKRKM